MVNTSHTPLSVSWVQYPDAHVREAGSGVSGEPASQPEEAEESKEWSAGYRAAGSNGQVDKGIVLSLTSESRCGPCTLERG